MKTFALACLFVAIAMAAFMPTHSSAALLRQRRDVSELSAPSYNYLPPMIRLAEETTAAPAALTDATQAPQESAILSNNGYEYKTVRRLKYRYRTRRDVSHLPQSQYLPPSNEYLPPLPLESTTIAAALPAEPKLANEYLPPVDVEITETESPAVVEEQETVAPAVEELTSDVAEVKQAPEETAILAEDGYHYKQPAAEPPQLKLIDADAYLPPVVEDAEAIVVEGPAESAILADDGYHYRAVKRYRF